jgi:hypothetical protein
LTRSRLECRLVTVKSVRVLTYRCVFIVRKALSSALIAAILYLLGSAAASAAEIELTFSGTIVSSSASGIDVGTSYSGEVLYDTGDPTVATIAPFEIYGFGPNDEISINVGGCTFSASGSGSGSNSSGVVDDQLLNFGLMGDFFGVTADAPNPSTCLSLSPSQLSLQLVGPLGLLTGNGIPTGFDFNNLVQPAYSGYGSDMGMVFGSQQILVGNFSAIQYSSVPEPSTVFPLIVVLAGVVWRRLASGRSSRLSICASPGR